MESLTQERVSLMHTFNYNRKTWQKPLFACPAALPCIQPACGINGGKTLLSSAFHQELAEGLKQIKCESTDLVL